MSSRPTMSRSARGLAVLSSVALVVGLLAATNHASAATPPFQAAGSARQVYVTGVAPSAQMSLLSPSGQIFKTQKANSLGGSLFRNVPPAAGYRVRRDADGVKSGAITVHSEDAEPWNPA